ncbi:MAG: ATP-binding protein [Paraprevotella sp.]|nr:ATP-binding protein [Paraprevotella sp.]
MSTIHDRNKKKPQVVKEKPLVETNLVQGVIKDIAPNVAPEEENEVATQQTLAQQKSSEVRTYQNSAFNALSLVNDIVLKNYLVQLSDMDLIEFPNISTDGVILFKINKMVYEKDEYATDKFISMVSAMTFTSSSVFLIVDGHKDHTDFYLGIRCEDENRTASSIAETFKSSICGQFPGIQMRDLSYIEKGASASEQDKIFARLREAKSISSCVVIPSVKNKNQERTNSGFVQGIEKLALAMRGKEYTAIVLAKNQTSEDIQNIRIGYETLYTQLSSQASQQLAYSNSESMANSFNSTKGYTDTKTVSEMSGKTHSLQYSKANTEGESISKGRSQKNFFGKAGTVAEPLFYAGTYLTATGIGAPVGAIMMGLGAAAGLGKVLGEGSKSQNDTKSKSETYTVGTNEGFTESHSESSSHADNFSMSNGQTATVGESKTVTITIRDKHIDELLKRIDNQLERINQAESAGLWQTGTYFLSYENDRATAEIGATIFRSIMEGENSGVEVSAINSWYLDSEKGNLAKGLPLAISSFTHPVFLYKNTSKQDIHVTGTSLVNSSELAMMIGLPRKSVPGLPIVEHASLAKEVVCYSGNKTNREIRLGCIFDCGMEYPENRVTLKQKSLTQHVFVTGSTGCGKSETVYKLIDEARSTGTKFLIIEPAKGEYKNVFGNVTVFGTNPKITKLLRINPFRFPTGDNGIHVLEHVDRLVEIFNVCWPMYAAMPAVLKKAVLACYEKCGWNLIDSNNRYSTDLFPTFADLQQELVQAINESAYSEEVKSNYTGSLVTRVESLTNGINGEIFASTDLSDEVLFDENAIIDLSRVGSLETKSLIMGILIMRLSEHRMSMAKEANSDLRHITILEEAHNILKRSSTEQSMEGSNIAGKSVEMITNAIAEMRTYGESFVIVDQSPTSVAPAAIKNTNTKIIMRLPDDDDRRITGKAASMKDNQIDEIAKLPTGVAVVYQNDWVAPVLCKIDMYKGERIAFVSIDGSCRFDNSKAVNAEILKLLLKGRINSPIVLDTDFILRSIQNCKIPTSLKIEVINIITEIKKGKEEIWQDRNFAKLSKTVAELLSAKVAVEQAVKKANDFKELDSLLDSFIVQRASISENLRLAVRQCLMMQYGEKNDTSKRIYNAWFTETKKELLS